MQSIHALKKMMVDCAEAAARMTGCKVEIRPIETNNAAMLSNQIMSKLFAQHLDRMASLSRKSTEPVSSSSIHNSFVKSAFSFRGFMV